MEYNEILNNNQFIEWFNGSKMKNENGIPFVFFHKSRAEQPFDFFRDDTNKNPYNNCKGFYFVRFFDENHFQHFAQGISLYVYLLIKNPYEIKYCRNNKNYIGCDGVIFNLIDINELTVQAIKQKGFDSVIIRNTGVAPDEYIAFYSSQIKSISNTRFTDSENIYE